MSLPRGPDFNIGPRYHQHLSAIFLAIFASKSSGIFGFVIFRSKVFQQNEIPTLNKHHWRYGWVSYGCIYYKGIKWWCVFILSTQSNSIPYIICYRCYEQPLFNNSLKLDVYVLVCVLVYVHIYISTFAQQTVYAVVYYQCTSIHKYHHLWDKPKTSYVCMCYFFSVR